MQNRLHNYKSVILWSNFFNTCLNFALKTPFALFIKSADSIVNYIMWKIVAQRCTKIYNDIKWDLIYFTGNLFKI